MHIYCSFFQIFRWIVKNCVRRAKAMGSTSFSQILQWNHSWCTATWLLGEQVLKYWRNSKIVLNSIWDVGTVFAKVSELLFQYKVYEKKLKWVIEYKLNWDTGQIGRYEAPFPVQSIPIQEPFCCLNDIMKCHPVWSFYINGAELFCLLCSNFDSVLESSP